MRRTGQLSQGSAAYGVDAKIGTSQAGEWGSGVVGAVLEEAHIQGLQQGGQWCARVAREKGS